MSSFFAKGEWNFTCDLCGRLEKSGRAQKTWDNHWVCMKHKEVRNPQDFLQAVKDDQTVPWSRVEPPAATVFTGLPILDTYGEFLADSNGAALLDVGA